VLRLLLICLAILALIVAITLTDTAYGYDSSFPSSARPLTCRLVTECDLGLLNCKCSGDGTIEGVSKPPFRLHKKQTPKRLIDGTETLPFYFKGKRNGPEAASYNN
jgi:hypothetical protein